MYFGRWPSHITLPGPVRAIPGPFSIKFARPHTANGFHPLSIYYYATISFNTCAISLVVPYRFITRKQPVRVPHTTSVRAFMSSVVQIKTHNVPVGVPCGTRAGLWNMHTISFMWSCVSGAGSGPLRDPWVCLAFMWVPYIIVRCF